MKRLQTAVRPSSASVRIKGWLREKKFRLIESVNAGWNDLAAEWFTGLG
jgi:predicted GIY-YIG superfamily endonuclease